MVFARSLKGIIYEFNLLNSNSVRIIIDILFYVMPPFNQAEFKREF